MQKGNCKTNFLMLLKKKKRKITNTINIEVANELCKKDN